MMPVCSVSTRRGKSFQRHVTNTLMQRMQPNHSPLQLTAVRPVHVYEVRPRKDHRGVDLISDALLFGRLWYGEPNAVSNAIGYAMHRSRLYDAVIRVYDAA